MGKTLQQNILADTIDTAGIKAKYDEWATKLLSQKIILAWILKYCTEEFSGYSVEYIRDKCIEGIPEVRCKAVHQDCPDAGPEMIQGMNTVDKSGNEGTITYDVKFQAAVPGESGIIQMIINVEIQLDDTPGYPVVKRSIYYSSRMISSQYGTVFVNEHYEMIRKVYSIWICPFVPNIRKDSIREYRFEETVYSGDYHEKRQNYDLIDIVILGLGDTGQKSEHKLVSMLTVLFSDRLESEEKKKILTEEYNIAMTREIEEGVDTMCNLSEGTYRRGIKDGIKQGIKQGINQGIKQGIGQGVILTYINTVIKKYSRGKAREEIITEMLEDTDAGEKEIEEMYDIVSHNPMCTAEEALAMYQKAEAVSNG